MDEEKNRPHWSLDFRIPVVWIIGFMITIIGQTIYVTQHIDRIETRVAIEEAATRRLDDAKLPARITRVEALQETLDGRFGAMDARLARMEAQLDRLVEAKRPNGR
jgi:Tfp pilus assembly protein PilO